MQTPVYSQPTLKSLRILHSCLSLILEGNYVSFGAMLFYNDTCVLQLLSTFSATMARLEFSDLATLPKLMHAVFGFLRSLLSANMLVVSVLPRDLFHFFSRLLVDGIACDGRVRRRCDT